MNAMKKLSTLILGSLCASTLFFSCSADASLVEETTALNSTTTLTTAADISSADLVGTWKIESMTSDVGVDFNQDQNFDTNILLESACFDNMYFTFEEDGDVHTTQARLFFDAEGNFICSEKDYSATYEVVNQDELKINFVVNGVSYSEVKTISLTSDGAREYLNISLTSSETDAAVYVSDDPGTTVASDINRIDFRYIKQ